MLSTRRNNWLNRLKGNPAKRRRTTRHDYAGIGTEHLEERVVLSAVGPTATGMVMPLPPDSMPTSIIFVDDDARPGGDGGSWETAFNNLNDALRLAASTDAEDDIFVMVGIYSPADDDGTLPVVDVVTPGATGIAMPIDIDPGGVPRAGTFRLPDGVDIYGGFEDASQLRPEQRTGRASDTILTGDLNRDDHLGRRDDNAWHVVTVNGSGDILLDRLTVTAGQADGSDTAARNTGGGILVRNSDGLKLHNVIVARNSADYQGGGLAVYNSADVQVSDSQITNNKALNGGGVYVEDSQLGVGDTKLAGNQSAGGGAIDANHSRLVLRGVKVGENTATNTAVDTLGGRGGALRLVDSTADIHGGTFAGNGARVFGGAIYAIGSNLHVDGTAFLSNTAGAGGGAIAIDGTTFTGTNMAVADNSAGIAAGGIGGLHSDMTVTNSTFRVNTADAGFGGALVAVGAGGDYQSTLWTGGNTFNGNRAGRDGGGVYVLNTNWASRGDQFIGNVAGENGGAVRIDEIQFENDPVTPIPNRPVLIDDGTLTGFAIAQPLPVPRPEARFVTSIAGARFEQNVAHGRDDTTILSGLGGAIFALTDLTDESHLGVAISDSEFVANVARNGGAIVLGNVNRAHISGSGFKGNHARAIPVTNSRTALVLNGDGGAILVGLADLSVTGSEFSGNHAGGSGGAVYTIAANLRVGNSRLQDNTARDSGGAIFVDQQSSVGITGSGLSNNEAGRRGGAIAASNSRVAVTASLVVSNHAGGNGGAVALRGSRFYTQASVYGANTARGDGGAIHAADSLAAIDGAFFIRNAAGGDGGAIAAKDSTLGVINSIFAGNLASGSGNAIHAQGSSVYLNGNDFGPGQDIVLLP